MNYASPKNILLILLAIIIIGGALLYSKYRTAQILAQNNSAVTAVSPTISTTSPKILNYSGDWQKTLTAQAAPSSWSAPAGISATASNAPLTATDIFSRDLFARYTSAKEAGEDTSDPQVQADIATQVMANGTLALKAKTYNRTSIKISADNSVAALKQYGNTVSTTFKSNVDKTRRSELTIVQDSLDKNDTSVLDELNPIITSATKTLNGLLAMQVPSAMADLHIKLINSLSELILSDQSFTKTFSDGVTSLQGLALYQKATQDMSDAITGIANYLVSVNVTFDPSEPGSTFTIQTPPPTTQ